MRMRILVIALVVVVAATLAVNYWLRYWPFAYHAAALKPEQQSPPLAVRFCSLAASARSHLPEMNPNAAALEDALQNGRIDHFECSGGFPGMTNAYYIQNSPGYFRLFDATNRVRVSSKGFYSSSPGRLVFFTGTNVVVALRYGGEDVFVFRDYYFRLKTPNNSRKFFPP